MQTDKLDKNKNTKKGLGLSFKLLVMTIIFVMISEVLIFVPSLANFRLNWMRDQLSSANLATLIFEAAPDKMIPEEIQAQILEYTGNKAIVMRGVDYSRMISANDVEENIQLVFDLREFNWVDAVMEVLDTMLNGGDRWMRLIGDTDLSNTRAIEVVVNENDLRMAMFDYGVNILWLSIVISIMTAGLVYLSLNLLMIRPITRLTQSMGRFREDPEDPARIIKPSKRSDEIGVSEREMSGMQRQIASLLKQKDHLAALGLAVAKINHDLRNILANAQLISDRISLVQDPAVQKSVPKLIASLDRAIELCSNTIKYGNAREAPPKFSRIQLFPFAEEVAEATGFLGQEKIEWENEIPLDFELYADPDQLFRILLNIIRNSMQALETLDEDDLKIGISAVSETGQSKIYIYDNGPGFPKKAYENLFKPFQGSVRPGGSGLGLAIVYELVKGHGGTISLLEMGKGAKFEIVFNNQS